MDHRKNVFAIKSELNKRNGTHCNTAQSGFIHVWEHRSMAMLLGPSVSMIKPSPLQTGGLNKQQNAAENVTDPLSDGSSHSQRAEHWCEGCGTESGFHRPRGISGRNQDKCIS